MKIRRHPDAQLGDAISMEDAISMLVIIFVLFVIFLVPLISIDKAKLEKTKSDTLWEEVIERWPAEDKMIRQEIRPYLAAIGVTQPLFVHKVTLATKQSSKTTYYEILDEDSSLVLFTHQTAGNHFHTLRMTSHGGSTTFRHGQLEWSGTAREWFIIDESNDYGESAQSQSYLSTYRQTRLTTLATE